MKIEFYENMNGIMAGMTLKDDNEPESGNMALHTSVSTESVIKNRKKLAEILGTELECFVCPGQTHSDNFYEAKKADKGRGAYEYDSAVQDTDALYTFEPGILLCCYSADCVPVLFHNREAGLIGVIHSGWQGTVKEISLKVFRHLINDLGLKPQDFKVYIAKAISQEKFEVDEDVYSQFKALGYAEPFIRYSEKTGKYHIDNQKTVKKQCELAGIPSDVISVDTTCTYTDETNCFSFRRDPKCGRHMSFIIRR